MGNGILSYELSPDNSVRVNVKYYFTFPISPHRSWRYGYSPMRTRAPMPTLEC